MPVAPVLIASIQLRLTLEHKSYTNIVQNTINRI